MEIAKRMSPSMWHLRGVVRQEFAGLRSVEAVFIDRGRKGTRVWTIVGRGSLATARALEARKHKVRQMRRDLKLNFTTVPRGRNPRTLLLRFFRRSGAICAYLRKPERRVA